MATKVYDTETIFLLDGTEILLTPLKIKYLREFMEVFQFVKTSADEKQALFFLSECARIAMKQYYPSIKSVFDLEDNLDMKTMYRVIDIAAGVKIDSKKEDKTIKEQAEESGSTWEDFDLAKVEAEAFLLGIWKDYEELESSMSMPELMVTLSSKRELEYEERKFLAAMQGVDLDKDKKAEGNAWEKLKARVFSKGKTGDPNDVTALQGQNAMNAGFGIGMGLDYVDMTKK